MRNFVPEAQSLRDIERNGEGMARVGVIGAGSWGTALAKVLHTNGNEVQN